ncbi:MAG: hypothetical protein HYU36_06295 [Planctomycetes bacterium]|nr:hypothetical protein [Planctomycetota bacterium]
MVLGQGLLRAEGAESARIILGTRSYLAVPEAAPPAYNWELKFENPEGVRDLDLLFNYRSAEEYYRFRWSGEEIELLKGQAGRETLLARARTASLAKRKAGEVLVRRRASACSVVLDERQELEARDGTHAGGRLAVGTGDERLRITALRMQPVEAIQFSDDFMRREEEQDLGSWSPVHGQWSFRSVMSEVRQNKDARIRKGKEPEAQRSANPFTFQAQGGTECIAVTGYRFWDDYDFSAAVKNAGGECGLAFYYRSPESYFLFSVDIASQRMMPSRARLVRVSPRGREILAERTVLTGCQQWYQLEVSVRGIRVQAFLDRVFLFDVMDAELTGGQAGLYASAPENTFFDDVRVASGTRLGLDRAEVLEACGKSLEGSWEVRAGRARAAGLPADPAVLENRSPAPSLYSFGEFGDEFPVLSVELRIPDAAGSVGLAFGCQDARNTWVLRVRNGDPDAGVLELVRVQGGRSQRLAAFPASGPRGGWSTWTLDLSEAARLRFYEDGELQVRCSLPESVKGRFAAWAEGAAGVQFRCVQMARASERDWEKIEDNTIFANDPYMQGWASPRWAWIPQSLESTPPPVYSEIAYTRPRQEMEYPDLPVEDGEKPPEVKKPQPAEEKAPEVEEKPHRMEYVHKGDFFGAFAIQLPLSDGLSLSFGDEDPGGARGYTLEVAASAGPESAAPAGTAAQAAPAAKATDAASPDSDADAVDERIRQEQEAARPMPAPRPKPEKREVAVRLRLKRQETVVGEGAFRLPAAPKQMVTVHREGRYLWVSREGQETLEFRDLDPLRGRRVRLVTACSSDLARVEVRRDHVRDYLFKEAPSDWLKVGQWEITNRFACDPRWSHLNGESKSDAILWHKDDFPGDVTLEFYAGMRMRQGRMKEETAMYYPRVGDLNATISASGEDLTTGYTFILGAWDPLWSETWTRLLRRDAVVAETDQQLLPRTRVAMDTARLVRVGWDPGGRAIHGAWYYIKIRRQGRDIRYYFDNHLALSYRDDSPLPGSRLGIWTYNNSMMVARVKISYETTRPSAEILDPPARQISDETAAPAAAPPSSIAASSPSHPGAFFDFESGLDGWTTPNRDDNTQLSLDPSTAGSGKASLRLMNALPGGEFGALIPLPEMNLLEVEQVSFDYRIPAGVRVHLYFSVREDPRHRSWCYLPLTGEDRSDEIVTRIEGVPAVYADGQWHHFSFRLGDALQKLYLGQTDLRLASAMVGNLHEGYLNVGFGGNGPGLAYHLDNFLVASRGGPGVQVGFGIRGGAGGGGRPVPQAAAASFSRTPDASADASRPIPLADEAAIELRAPASGLWYLALAARIEPGSWTPVGRIPVFIEASAPAVVSMRPPDGADWSGEPIRLTLAEGNSLLPARVQIECDGRAVPLLPPGLSYDRDTRILAIDLRASGLVFADGQAARFRALLPARETALSGSHPWTYTYRMHNDQDEPDRVRLLGEPARFDFEGPETGFEHFSEEAAAVRDAGTAAGGKASLKLFNRFAGSPFTVPFAVPAFLADRYPLLAFDYRVDRVVRSNFVLEVQGEEKTLPFTDRSSDDLPSAGIPEVVADGQWHHLEMPLRQILAAQTTNAGPDALKVSALRMQDQGYQGNAPGATIHLDNFQLVPCVSSPQGIPLRWSARDLSGVRGFSFSWSLGRPADPGERILLGGDSHTFRDAPEGDAYLNLRAVDAAGNWGPLSSFRFFVDNTPPAIVKAWPPAGSASASRSIRILMADALSGILAAPMTITLNGKPYAFQAATTRVHGETGELEWEWAVARGPTTSPTPDGETLNFKVENLRDTAGNCAESIEWSWTVRHEEDRSPPLAPAVKSASHQVLSLQSFSDSEESAKPFQETARLLRIFDAEKADYCLQVIQRCAGNYGASLVAQPFDVARFPILSFEYRLPKATKPALWAKVAGEWKAFTRGPDFIADGEWHLAACDLEPLFQQEIGAGRVPTCEELAIVDYSYSATSSYDASFSFFWLDGIALVSRAGDAEPVFEFGVHDETGVSQYSFAIDQNYDRIANAGDLASKLGNDLAEKIEKTRAEGEPDGGKVDFGFDRFQKTIPDETGEGLFMQRKFPAFPRSGIWFLHVRARDGAGNWGPTTHYPYFCTEAQTSEEVDDVMPEE